VWSGDRRYGDALQPAPPARVEEGRTVELAGWSAALYLNDE
jgi:hypothetical protein